MTDRATDRELTTTYWYCERCRLNGQIKHDAHVGAWEVAFHFIQDAHIEASNGKCGGFLDIRVSTQPFGTPPLAARPPR